MSEEAGRRRVWPWVVGAVVLLFVAVVALVIVAVVAGSAGGGAVATDGVTWEEEYVFGEGADKVAVLPVSGQIAAASPDVPLSGQSATPEALRSQLQQVAEDDSVKAVVVEVDSPGGGVVASDVMHDEISDFQRREDKPVVVSMQTVAASGGYYIAAPADSIVAHPSTITGSIGVISTFPDVSEALEKLGIKQQVIKSGEFKDIGSPTDELSPQEREILKTQIEQSYDRFVEVIVDGRKLPEERVREIGDGRIYSGEQAQELGLVDELGDLQDAAAEARSLAELDRATVVRYESSPGLLESLQARISPPEPEALKLLREAGLDPTVSGPQYLYRPGI